jgi:hypothetical protein
MMAGSRPFLCRCQLSRRSTREGLVMAGVVAEAGVLVEEAELVVATVLATVVAGRSAGWVGATGGTRRRPPRGCRHGRRRAATAPGPTTPSRRPWMQGAGAGPRNSGTRRRVAEATRPAARAGVARAVGGRSWPRAAPGRCAPGLELRRAHGRAEEKINISAKGIGVMGVLTCHHHCLVVWCLGDGAILWASTK